ncbi:MAG: hypothetical protein LAO06_19625, partial [Acidobacteriia bacterium]|nr:hypothetical protein [Terriglobia bacterium]
RSIDLWKQQIDIIQAHHGLISFIIHPDYMVGSRERDAYRELLTYVTGLASDRGVWLAFPGEINCWWRQRRGMRLVRQGQGWHIEGEGSERARLAYAHIVDGSLRYRIVPQPKTPQSVLSPGARARGSGK